jgi:hypothetical protein
MSTTILFLIAVGSFAVAIYIGRRERNLATELVNAKNKEHLHISTIANLRAKNETLKMSIEMQQKITKWAESEFKILAHRHAEQMTTKRFKRSDPKFEPARIKAVNEIINTAYGVRPAELNV